MMQTSISQRLVLAGLIGLGLTTFTATSASAAPKKTVERASERAVNRSGDDVEEKTGFDRIPEAARRKIDETKGREKLLATYHIRRSGVDYYRATVQYKKTERVILVTADGVLKNVEDIRPEEFRDYQANPDSWYRDYDDRMIARDRVYLQQADRVTATVDNPERVNFDQCPARVRNTLTRESGGQKVDYVIRYRDHNEVIYQTTLDDGQNQRHMVQIRPDGTVFNEGEFSKGGGGTASDWKPRTIGFDDLPQRVRETVDNAAPKGRIPHVEVAKRRGRDVYTVQVQTRDGDRYLTINDEGKTIADVNEAYDVGSSNRNR
jgi:hypothetical protein